MRISMHAYIVQLNSHVNVEDYLASN